MSHLHRISSDVFCLLFSKRLRYKWSHISEASFDWIGRRLDTFNEVQPTWIFAKQIGGLTLFVKECVQGILVFHISSAELLQQLVVFLCFSDHGILSLIKRVHLEGWAIRYDCDHDLLLICLFLFRRRVATIYVQSTRSHHQLILWAFSRAFLCW